MVLAEFIDQTGLRNIWLKYPHMEVYVRKGTHYIAGEITKTLDIANIAVEEEFQNRGIFSAFLVDAEERADKNGLVVRVESILNNGLYEYLIRRGYTPFPQSNINRNLVRTP